MTLHLARAQPSHSASVALLGWGFRSPSHQKLQSCMRTASYYLIKLLDEKAIPHQKVGTHRRVRMEDVMAYKNAVDRKHEKVLDCLTREAQENGMGHDRS